MKSLRLYLIIAGLLIVGYTVARLNQPKEVDWSETLSSKDKIPFGTYILNNRLKDIFPGSRIIPYRQPVYNVIADDSVKNASYIIICNQIDLTKADYSQLISYLKAGNNVFIAAGGFGKQFYKELKVNTAGNYAFGNDIPKVSFVSPSLNPKKTYSVNKGVGNLYFQQFDTLRAVVIGENAAHKANFIKYSYGKGSLYLVANPLFFSNYSLLHRPGAEYAATALSYLKATPRIIIDEYYTRGDGGNASPMRVFLSNYALQWAYYIAIFSLVIFVVFEMKRRQRIIPVIEPLQNSTLDFVNVVGQVYYEKHDNANIAQKKILYFLTRLRDEYGLKTNKLDDELANSMSAKLNIERQFTRKLIDYFKYITVQDRVTDHELIELNKLIEQFYIKSR